MIFTNPALTPFIPHRNENNVAIADHISHVGTFTPSGNRFIQGHSSTDVKRVQVVGD